MTNTFRSKDNSETLSFNNNFSPSFKIQNNFFMHQPVHNTDFHSYARHTQNSKRRKMETSNQFNLGGSRKYEKKNYDSPQNKHKIGLNPHSVNFITNNINSSREQSNSAKKKKSPKGLKINPNKIIFNKPIKNPSKKKNSISIEENSDRKENNKGKIFFFNLFN